MTVVFLKKLGEIQRHRRTEREPCDEGGRDMVRLQVKRSQRLPRQPEEARKRQEGLLLQSLQGMLALQTTGFRFPALGTVRQ